MSITTTQPTTIAGIKQAIENAKTIQRIEQLKIDALERSLAIKMEEATRTSAPNIKGSKIAKNLLKNITP